MSPSPIAPALGFEAGIETLAEVVSTLGTDRFPAALTALLRRVAPVIDTVVVTLVQGEGRPVTLYHELEPDQVPICTDLYEGGAYLLDPFVHALRRGLPGGVYRLDDVAPDNFRRGEYYRTFYKLLRLSDEVSMNVILEGGRAIFLSLATAPDASVFSRRTVATLQGVFPLVAALVVRHWGEAGRRRADPPGGRPVGQDPMERLAGGLLSARERDVLKLVLEGYSSGAVALRLGIAEGTVKVHRRHAYAKLRLGGQAELFARYMAVVLEGAGEA
jgi:DNA-binding CsgD family transcriptional regulator